MWIDVPGGTRLRLPDFFVPGVAKAGTTAVYMLLRDHPGVFAPDRKEPRFFSSNYCCEATDEYPAYPMPDMIRDITAYSAIYSRAPENALLGDFSPFYLYTYRTTIRNIREIYGANELWRTLKFIILVRNPVDVAWSLYWTNRRLLGESMDFDAAMDEMAARERSRQNCFHDYPGAAMFASQLEAWLESFPVQNTMIELFDDFKHSNDGTMRRILDFLGLDNRYVFRKANTNFNPSGVPKNPDLLRLLFSRHPVKLCLQSLIPDSVKQTVKRRLVQQMVTKVEMPPETRGRLLSRFSDEICRIEELIQRDLSAWRKA